MNAAVLHYYRQNRAHGQTALAAWNGARSFVHFKARLAERVKADKRRTKAAKCGWKTRRSNSPPA